MALQIGHRKSVDLDLFGRVESNQIDLTDDLRSVTESMMLIQESRNIHIYLLNQVKVDIVNYSYKWLKEPVKEEGLILAAKEDIAAMKIAAVVGRGTKKDFIDLAFLLDYYPLKDILSMYMEKYPEASMFVAMKSLTYFRDAETDAMPDMLVPVSWKACKDKLISAVNSIK
ncbi:MAG: nucleotidyl transferase AbiEii/AbiGii toxin family protein [Victivallales bacterium]|nr:nucleotidyl transferase AbiEii/AbiGii toxin family protein [Victivallales bacterium]